MATIREVARLAGVSPATVSRVMNGTAKVDEEKAKRVWDAIRETGFQPNELARALYKKSSRIIGLIVPNIENPFFSELAKTIEEETYRRGGRLLLCSSNNDGEKERINIQMLNTVKADGLILVTNSPNAGELIAGTNLPVVVLDRHVKGGGEIAHIESDHYQGGRLAAQHLVDCGCKSIVCLRGPQEFNSGVERFRGYRDVCQENHLPVQYIGCEYTYEAGLQAAEQLLQVFPYADGVLAANDMAAISVYKVLHGKGVRIPEDIQLVGFDDIGIAALMTPALTTVAQPIAEMGKKAVATVCSYDADAPIDPEIVFPVKLVPRETTRPK